MPVQTMAIIKIFRPGKVRRFVPFSGRGKTYKKVRITNGTKIYHLLKFKPAKRKKAPIPDIIENRIIEPFMLFGALTNKRKYFTKLYPKTLRHSEKSKNLISKAASN